MDRGSGVDRVVDVTTHQHLSESDTYQYPHGSNYWRGLKDFKITESFIEEVGEEIRGMAESAQRYFEEYTDYEAVRRVLIRRIEGERV